MALQTCKTKIQHKTDTPADSNNDTSQGGRTIIVRSPCDCRTMTAQYPCHFTGTARASCGDLAIAVRGPYDHHKSLRSSCDIFVPKRPAKTLRSPHDRRAITLQCPYGDRAMLLRRVYGSTILNFLYNSELNKIVGATTTLRRPKNVRYRTISVRRSHENGNLGIVGSP